MGRKGCSAPVGSTYGCFTVVEVQPLYNGQSSRLCMCNVCNELVRISLANLKANYSKRSPNVCHRIRKHNKRRISDSSYTRGRKRALVEYKWNAKKRGISWELSDGEALALMGNDCHYCGSKPSLVQRDGRDKGLHTMEKYTRNGIDRKNNSIGYTSNNCVPCCKQCNIAKGDLDYDQWTTWIDTIVEYQRADIGAKEPKEETPFVVNWPVYRSPKELFIN